MKAAVFHESGQPLRIENRPIPTPGPGEVLVKVAACGLCHSDLHYLDHGTPTFKKPPLVLGHEAAGWVEGTGQAVIIPAVLTCGECALCRSGRANICERMQMPGNHIDGAFAEFVAVPRKDLVPMPPGLDPVEACLIADAVTTAFHAVHRRAQVRPGQRVAVFGCGGVGLSAVQCAVIAGAHVIAVDLDESKLALARTLGAAETLLVKVPKASVDVAIECIGKPATIQQAHASIRRGGRLCIVGFCGEPVPLEVSRIMFHEQDVVGSLGCRPEDYPAALDLVMSGRFRLAPLITARRPLSEINEAFDDLRAGRSVRTVILPR